MSTSADYELIVAALAAVRADAAVAALVGTRVWERPPQSPTPTMPYVSVGPTSSVPDDVDCADGEEITFQLDIWSAGAGQAHSSAECRQLTDAVKRVLHHAELTLAENALVTLECSLKQILRDPDGITNHGVLQFTAVVETP